MKNYAVFGAVIQLEGIAGWRWGSDQMNNYAVFSAVISWKALLNGCVLSLLCAGALFTLFTLFWLVSRF